MKKIVLLISFLSAALQLFAEPPAGKNWKLVYEDNFDYPNEKLDENWISQNYANSHILSSRWRENVTVENGIMRLLARKESRGGQDWTSGSIQTRTHFKFGYYECRYKYAAATGTNNAFWLMTQGWQTLPEGKKRFEIDINEGHYPDEININLHDWSEFYTDKITGKKRHNSWGKSISLCPRTGQADRTISLDVPVKTRKLRLSSNKPEHFHLRELRVFPKNSDGYYPDVKLKRIPLEFRDLENYALTATIASSSPLNEDVGSDPKSAIDGNIDTSWVTHPVGEKFIELDFGEEKEIGAVQFLTGWLNGKEYVSYIYDYKVEIWNGSKWQEIAELKDDTIIDKDLSADYHTYALEWNEEFLIYYFDGKEIFRQKNTFCDTETPVLLSLAIANFAGSVTDKIDGTSMDVDYVKVWQEAGKESVKHYPQKK